jgi:hypothetical protein
MYPSICKHENWSSVEAGTLNVQLADYVTYTHARRVDFLVPHTVTRLWDCYFQRCKIRRPGDAQEIAAVIATTGDNFWGRGGIIRKDGIATRVSGATIEIMSNVHICKTLALKAGDGVEIVLP